MQSTNHLVWLPVFLCGALLVTSCANQKQAVKEQIPASEQYPNNKILVTPDWLDQHLNDPNMRIIDMRSNDAYTQTHIPGAVNVPVGDVTSTVDGVPFEFDMQKVQESLNRIGLRPDQTVIIYDNLGMMDSGRLFWTLEYVGHKDVHVLHGGWNAWNAAGFETADTVPEIPPSEYPIQLDQTKLVTAEQVLQALDDPDVSIVDSRSPDEYTGQVKLAERGGHIPGAVNLPWLSVLTGGDAVYTTQSDWQSELMDKDVEMFKSASDIQGILDNLDLKRDQEVITYCQTLWRGVHTYFLLRLMGFEDVRGYDGSWAEWGNNPELPVVTGEQPGSIVGTQQ